MSVDDAEVGTGRMAGADTFRGVLVIAAAVIVGVLLLSRGLTDDPAPADEQAAETDDGAGPADAAAPPAGGEGTTATTAPSVTSTTAPPAVRQPSEVRVLVLNGSGRSGEAARGVQFFTDAGYVADEPRNAPSNGPSAIYFVEGYAAEAAAAAAALGVDAAALVEPIDPAAPPIDDLGDANLVVMAGTDGAIVF